MRRVFKCLLSFLSNYAESPPPTPTTSSCSNPRESISSRPLGGGIDWINASKLRETLLSPSLIRNTKGAQTWTWSIMCQAFLPQWMNGPMTIGYRPSIVHWHWRLSSHAVHYPERGQLERDPKRPLIIIPFREEKKKKEERTKITSTVIQHTIL